MSQFKQIVILLYILLCNNFSYAQIVNIPDKNFLKALIKQDFDLNNDGQIQVSEAEAVTGSLTDGYSTSSIKGIEAFKNITIFSTGGNKFLDSVDLSANKKLKIIEFTNSYIGYLNVTGLVELEQLSVHTHRYSLMHDSSFNNLDLSTNINLKYLSIQGTAMEKIDLSNNTKLVFLDLLKNKFREININNLDQLEELITYFNPLTSLDLKTNTNLLTLNFGDDLLSCLDLSACTKLQNVYASYFFTYWGESRLRELDVSNQLKLNRLAMLGSKNKIKKVCLPSIDTVFIKQMELIDSEFIYCLPKGQPDIYLEQFKKLDSLFHFSTDCNNNTLELDNNKICVGTPINLKIHQPDTIVAYNLAYGDGTSSNVPDLNHIYNKTGKMDIQLIADFKCHKDTATTTVTVYPQPPQSIFENYTCTKNATVLDAGLGFQNYLWQNGDTNQTFKVNQVGKYKVTASNICGTITDSTEVQFIKKELTISTPRLCVINEAEFDVQNIQYPVLNYHWTYGNNATANINQTKYKYPKAGTYNANLIVDYYCFKDTATTQVIVDDTPILNIGDSIITCNDTPIELNAGAGFVSYHWQDGFKNQNYSVTQSGIYTVAVTNTCGTQTDSVTIKKVHLELPNIITPNNDGLNEALQIQSQLANPIHLNITNRWGSEVFNATNYQNNWDASGLSDGIYYYTANYEGCEAVKGWVQVAR